MEQNQTIYEEEKGISSIFSYDTLFLNFFAVKLHFVDVKKAFR